MILSHKSNGKPLGYYGVQNVGISGLKLVTNGQETKVGVQTPYSFERCLEVSARKLNFSVCKNRNVISNSFYANFVRKTRWCSQFSDIS